MEVILSSFHSSLNLVIVIIMAKKNKKGIVPATVKQVADTVEIVPAAPKVTFPSWLCDFKFEAVTICLLAFVFYVNTTNNDYALDDTVVIVKNEYVQEGFAGIPGILTKDAYYSYYRQLNTTNQLSGGRYRPLSIVTFAVEQQFFGAIPQNKVDSVMGYGMSYAMNEPYEKHFLHDMHIRHFFNVVWFALSMVVLLYFLRYIVFRSDPVMAFIAVILFTIHPIHTEVVANVKSRDEIMSLLFICVTFICAFKYRESKNKWMLAAGLCSYFLAFLSKEYAITLLVLLPLSFCLFINYSARKSIVAALPYFAVAALYLFVRYQTLGPRNDISDSDIQINPYAYASHTEKLATEIATSVNYLKLLIFPHPLSSDYSYPQIPYKDFDSPVVWLSLSIHLLLAGGLFYFFKKRSVLCFAIAFYLLNLLLVNNFIFDIGATMGERLIYHASVGFVIAVAYLLYKGMERVKPVSRGKASLAGLLLLLIILCGFKTIERNKDWKNDETLFFHDVNVSPNSFLVNANVACMLVNKSDYEQDEQKRRAELERGVTLYTKVLGMQDNAVLAYMNRCVAYYKLQKPDSMMADLGKVMLLYPIHPLLPEMYYRAGMLYYSDKQYAQAASALQASLKLNPRSADAQKALNMANAALQPIK
jgi:protein O-mannosyl-transferase